MTDHLGVTPHVPSTDAVLDDAQPPDQDQDSIGSRAGRGFGWAMAGQVVMKMGSFGVSLVMVRLMAPHDFGLYAVALAVNAFVIHVNDMGMIAATVQWRGRVEDMAATARTMSAAFSVAWYAVIFTAAPFIAELAGSPDATHLVRLLSLTILLDGVTAVSVGVLLRTFRQDALMKAIAIGFVFSAVISITCAVNGAGAISFVLGMMAQSAVVGVIVLRKAGIPIRFGFDRVIAQRLIVFGAPLALGLGIESILMYSDSVIIGHELGTDVLGFYLLAFNVSSWVPGMVGTAVRYVSIPAFSRLAEGDKEALDDGVQRSLPMMIALVAPIAALMAALSPALIHFLYGKEWIESADALRFLAAVMVARMFTALVFDIQTGLGNTRFTVLLNVVWLVALVPSLWFGAHYGGMSGAAAAHAVIALLVAMPFATWMLHRAGVDMVPVAKRIARPVLAGVAAGLTMAAVAHPIESHFVQLVVAGGSGFLLYGLLAFPARTRRYAWSRVRPLLARGAGPSSG